MSIFDNIVLDEFTMLDEGKQAEEYKARKAKEKRDSKIDTRYVFGRRSQNFPSDYKNEYKYKADEENKRKSRNEEEYQSKKKAAEAIDREVENRSKARDKALEEREKELHSYHRDDWETASKRHRKRENDISNYHNILDKKNAAADAYRRHARRHPKAESALMLIAGYDSEFAY